MSADRTVARKVRLARARKAELAVNRALALMIREYPRAGRAAYNATLTLARLAREGR